MIKTLMIPKNNNFTLTIQNPCVEYLQYLEKANCGVFLIGGHCYSRLQIWKIKDDKKNNDSKSRLYIEFCQKTNTYLNSK